MKNEETALDKTNIEQQKAYDLVANTNISLFITGKAGTGKTTFVKRIQEEINKNFLVLAPTGIAALNVGGQTIHSFFGFPFEAIGPSTPVVISPEKWQVLEHVETIIIDEASMVRCDWVDGIDRVLRSLMYSHLPFGGKQVVFVGDLFQLPPVVKKGSADDEMLCHMYGTSTPYFYKANVMKRMNLPKIEFLKVYRQEDLHFLEILNRMRVGENTREDMNTLNQHVSSDDEVGDFSVALTAYIKVADGINHRKLDELDAEEYRYEGIVEGDFRMQDSPVPVDLRLKVGAQVIFCRNDYFNGFVNGTIAKVIELDEDLIKVVIEDGTEIQVGKMVWESRKSVYKKETRKVESEVVGTFTQYPLKLAWAITIHKSQGMTFSRMHFDLTRGTFAPGQAYVAVSRMRSLDGLTLSKRISPHDIKQNVEIKAFSNSFNDTSLIEEEREFGTKFFNYLESNDYDNAARVCLQQALSKLMCGDYRTAAIMAKKMFDVMLDDECLIGLTNDISLLKDCSMTCDFLNAVLCLYGNRHEEAIGYVNMVLDRRACLEAMLIKAKSLCALGRYTESLDTVNQIYLTSAKSEDKVPIDKKLLLFQAKLNDQLGQSNMDTCKFLCKLCPDYIPAYVMIRKEALKRHFLLAIKDDDTDKEILNAFNNISISDEEFEKMLSDAAKNSIGFRVFKKRVRKIGEKEDADGIGENTSTRGESSSEQAIGDRSLFEIELDDDRFSNTE